MGAFLKRGGGGGNKVWYLSELWEFLKIHIFMYFLKDHEIQEVNSRSSREISCVVLERLSNSGSEVQILGGGLPIKRWMEMKKIAVLPWTDNFQGITMNLILFLERALNSGSEFQKCVYILWLHIRLKFSSGLWNFLKIHQILDVRI